MRRPLAMYKNKPFPGAEEIISLYSKCS